MNTKKKLEKAKIQLIQRDPFYASLVMGLPLVEDPGQETGATDGSQILYNPAFIDGLTLGQVVFFLGHEVLHITGMHHTRMGLRELERWNEAADYAINPLLIEGKVGDPIPGILVDPRFDGMSAEQVYNLLPPGKGKGKGDPGGAGGVLPSPARGKAQRAREEQRVRDLVQRAVANAKKVQGTFAGRLARAIDEWVKPEVDWREVLAVFITEKVRNDYSYRRPNPRFLHTGFYLPVLETEEVGEIVLVVDTSGSINKKLLNRFGSEMQEIVNTFGKGFRVLYVDKKVQGEQFIEPDGPVRLTPSGGGGTDFRPAFDHVEAQDLRPKVLVYFTDGVCNLFPATPDYPVLWALYGKRKFKPPFGEVVSVNESA